VIVVLSRQGSASRRLSRAPGFEPGNGGIKNFDIRRLKRPQRRSVVAMANQEIRDLAGDPRPRENPEHGCWLSQRLAECL
jgi:hypothetical protein